MVHLSKVSAEAPSRVAALPEHSSVPRNVTVDVDLVADVEVAVHVAAQQALVVVIREAQMVPPEV